MPCDKPSDWPFIPASRRVTCASKKEKKKKEKKRKKREEEECYNEPARIAADGSPGEERALRRVGPVVGSQLKHALVIETQQNAVVTLKEREKKMRKERKGRRKSYRLKGSPIRLSKKQPPCHALREREKEEEERRKKRIKSILRKPRIGKTENGDADGNQ